MKYLFSMVIWGEEYAREFLELSLPSQLAEGNIDGSAWHEGSKYLILTTRKDAEIIKAHPAFHLLQKRLKVGFAYIKRLPGSEMYKLASQCQMEAIRVAKTSTPSSSPTPISSGPNAVWVMWRRALLRAVTPCSAPFPGRSPRTWRKYFQN